MASFGEEKTYRDLLGPIDEAATIWCECLFADPVSDVAILGEPDGQDCYDQSEAHLAFTEAATPIKIRQGKMGESAWVLGLDGGVPVWWHGPASERALLGHQWEAAGRYQRRRYVRLPGPGQGWMCNQPLRRQWRDGLADQLGRSLARLVPTLPALQLGGERSP